MAGSFDRRTLLGAAGATLGSLLAGCSFSSSPTATLTHDRIVWHRSPIADEVALLNEALYYSTGTDLYAVAVTNGEERWSRHVEDEPNLHSDETTCLRAEVATDGEQMYVPSCEGIRAVSPEDGADLWTAGSTELSTVVATGTSVYAGGSDIVAVTPSSETVAWQTAIGADEELYLAPTGDGVVACDAAAGVVHRVDAAGTSRWQHTLEWEGRPPVVADGTVYAAGVRDQESGRLVALDLSTGSVDWTVETPAVSPDGVAAGPDHIYVGTYPDETGAGHLIAIERDSGETRWEHTVAESDFSTPIVDANGVYAGTDEGVSAFAHDGTERWVIETEYPTSGIGISDGTLYAGVTGDLIAIDVTAAGR